MTARRYLLALFVLLLIGGGAVLLFDRFVPVLEEAEPAEPAMTPEQHAIAERLLRLRDVMDRNFGPHIAPLTLADSALLRGNEPMAMAAIDGALKGSPDNAELLSARPLALYIAGGMELTPAISAAFDEARGASMHPGPAYFQGAAELIAGHGPRALELWRQALEKGTPTGEWRQNVTAQIDALEQALAEEAASGMPLTREQIGEILAL